MKKNLVTFAVAAALLVPAMAFASDSSSVTKNGPILYGYAQITGSQQFGTGPSTSNGLVFGANRIRLGVMGQATQGVTYNIMAGWDNAGFSNGLTMDNALNNGLGGNIMGGSTTQLLDAYINFAPVPFAQLQVGKFKAPEGLEYTMVKGNELPFIYRNMGQSLLPGRSAGAMFHASNVMGTGIGYAVGMFDNTSADAYSIFSTGNTFGDGQHGFLNGNGKYLLSAMLSYSMGPLLTAEVSGAMATNNSGVTNGLNSWNVGVMGGLMGIHYGAGFTRATGVQQFGNGNYGPLIGTLPTPLYDHGYSVYDWHAEVGANLYQMTLSPIAIEPMVRYDSYTVHGAGTLGNTTVGLNYFVNPDDPHAAQVQLNYIMPTRGSLINQKYQTGYAPINGVAYNTLMLQFQAGF